MLQLLKHMYNVRGHAACTITLLPAQYIRVHGESLVGILSLLLNISIGTGYTLLVCQQLYMYI